MSSVVQPSATLAGFQGPARGAGRLVQPQTLSGAYSGPDCAIGLRWSHAERSIDVSHCFRATLFPRRNCDHLALEFSARS